MKNLKIKVIVGFRGDQHHTIEADEAHKAYYLFEHPTERGIFNNGVAIRGQDIQSIVPDYHTTMGWNPSHALGGDDYNELRKNGVMIQMSNLMSSAKEIAQLSDPKDLRMPLLELIEKKYPRLSHPNVERREGQVKTIGEIIKK